MITIPLNTIKKNGVAFVSVKNFTVNTILPSLTPVVGGTYFTYIEFVNQMLESNTWVVSETIAQIEALINPPTPPVTPEVFGYVSGVSGTVTLTGNKKVKKISATAIGSAGNIVINGGTPIVMPAGGAEDVITTFTSNPEGLVDPTITFNSTDSYYVEYTV